MTVLRLIVDAILVLILAEAFGLAILHRRTGFGIPSRCLIGNLGAGFVLLLALHFALARPLWPIWPCLLGALAFHLHDLRSRWDG